MVHPISQSSSAHKACSVSQAIPIPATTLKRPANEALSPEPPKHSPHVPRTPTPSQGFQEFAINYNRDPELVPSTPFHAAGPMEVDLPTIAEHSEKSRPSSSVVNDGELNNGAVMAQIGNWTGVATVNDIYDPESEASPKIPPVSAFNSISVVQPMEQPPPPSEQNSLRLAIQESIRKKSEGIYFLLAIPWFRNWSEYVVSSESDKGRSLDEPPGPINNSTLFTTKTCTQIQDNLRESVDFVAVSEDIWRLLLRWYGMVHERHAIQRRTFKEPKSLESKWVLDVYPHQLEIVHINASKDRSEIKRCALFRGETLSEALQQICKPLQVETSNARLWLIAKKGRVLVTDLDKTLGELNVDRVQRAELETKEPGTPWQVNGADDAHARADTNALRADADKSDGNKEQSATGDKSRAEIHESGLLPELADPVDTRDALSPISIPIKAETKRERLMRRLNNPLAEDEGKDEADKKPLMLGYQPLSPVSREDPAPQTKTTSHVAISGFSLTRARTRLPVGATGLSNLGNTCFMNSALQCLSNTPPLTKYFLKGLWEKELNRDNPLGMKGEVAAAYADLILQLWRPDPDRPGSFAPRGFKSTIGRFNPMFSGYSQQDSQELLGFLVDGLHEDLNRILKKPYIEAPDMDGQPEEAIAAKAWEIYSLRNDSVIVDLFQGQYKSRVECTVCGKWSVTFDPYMFLSVPIPDHRQIILSVRTMPQPGIGKSIEDDIPRVLHLILPKDATIATLKELVIRRMGWNDPDRGTTGVYAVEIYQGKIFKIFEDTEPVTSIGTQDEVYVVELGAPDWDLFEVPHAERTVANIRHIPVYFTREPTHMSRSDREQFGIPLIVSVPATMRTIITPNRCGGLEQQEVDELLDAISSERLYRAVLRTLRRYTRFPLFLQQGSMRIQDVYEKLQELQQMRRIEGKESFMNDFRCIPDEYPESFDSCASDVLLDFENSIRFVESSPNVKCEPIKDLFVLSVSQAAQRYSPPVIDFYQSGWNSYQSERTLLYDGEELYKKEQQQKQNDDEDSTDADDEASDSDPMQTHSYVRRPRSLSRGHQAIRRTGGTSASDSDDDDKLRLSSIRSFKAEAVLFMEWRTTVSRYVLREDAFTTREDPGNEAVRAEWEAKRNGPRKVITLQDCFDEYRKEEVLGDDNSWYCPQCKEHRPTKKKLDIWTVPEILVFHLKRFSNAGRGYRSMMSDKIDSYVDAPIQGLDLTKVVVGKQPARKWRSRGSLPEENKEKPAETARAQHVEVGSGGSALTSDGVFADEMDVGEPSVNLAQSAAEASAVRSEKFDDSLRASASSELDRMEVSERVDSETIDTSLDKPLVDADDEELEAAYQDAKTRTPKPEEAEGTGAPCDEEREGIGYLYEPATDSDDEESLVYDLFAVSNHYGGLGGGHYTAYAKNALDSQWYHFDDSHVSKTDESDVMTSAAYLLFYQRRHKGNKTDLTKVLEEVQKRAAAAEAAAAAARAEQSSLSSFLRTPSAPFPMPLGTHLSQPSGTGLVSPITTSAETTRNNSPQVSPAGSLGGSAISSDNEESETVNRERKARTTPGVYLDHGPCLPSSERTPFGPIRESSPAASFSVGFDWGQRQSSVNDGGDTFLDARGSRSPTEHGWGWPSPDARPSFGWSDNALEQDETDASYQTLPLMDAEADRLEATDVEIEDLVSDEADESRKPQTVNGDANGQDAEVNGGYEQEEQSRGTEGGESNLKTSLQHVEYDNPGTISQAASGDE
ncbi:uncharacterized protein SPPG_05122 [Spizellomyces punctatus DAOM BR117]|uniref:ubiquitinyl hydrolase 1 n=1 Tax=Spizellomyces punctatus (strain DAOM BR117) TaxID=645134 RepID=A0A0L0HF51_SPIPD|nr:uncharacterized protein SPPG_05122 [Spizellomyces punctatus DAOM BR117]KNC99742.1 hypothetical protein SPPG_05122 [Spizellomyces punctatus DAOM BR117]|eukprot:XP_016607782.1 hypothetical protein SPPG_05122 [Spizellomyces punctatus DAOM BR117]